MRLQIRWKQTSPKDLEMHMSYPRKHKIDMRKATMVLAVERVT